jgi:hypothetical protein
MTNRLRAEATDHLLDAGRAVGGAACATVPRRPSQVETAG